MKKRKTRSSINLIGAISFFVLIAIVMQVAILCYDYIIDKTEKVSLIALFILIEIVIVATFCTIFDWIRRIITVDRPTKKILNATEKIAEGDFSTRLEIVHEYGKYNEYDLIMENLNKMATELQKNEVLKTDFISNVSHEIKTPLAVIQNYATLLSDDTLDSETRKDYAKTLIGASKRITDLITNILKLNKLENQEIQEKPDAFNLTVSCLMTVDKKGNVKSSEIVESVICSTYKMTYDEVEKILQNDEEICKKYVLIKDLVYLFAELTHISELR